VSEDWVSDDPAIRDEDLILRRVRKIPDCMMPNVLSGKAEVKAGALKFDEDGMSVYLSGLLCEIGVDRGAFCDWEQYHAIEFRAADPRAGSGGVVGDPDAEDDQKGAAHGLVRAQIPAPTKAMKRAIRNAITAAYRWMIEDPNCPGR
jgi:hypothetical protein